MYYAVWYSHDPFRHGMIPAFADRTAALITSNKREIRHLTLRRAPVDLGVCILRSKLKAPQAKPTISALLPDDLVRDLDLNANHSREILDKFASTTYRGHLLFDVVVLGVLS